MNLKKILRRSEMDLICKVGSLRRRCNLTSVTSAKQCQDCCSRPPTHWTNYRKSVSNVPSSWLANRQWHFKQANHSAYSNPGTQGGGGGGVGRTRILGCGISECVPHIIGTLRSDKVNANEKVTKKLTSHPFKLFRPHNESPSDLKVRKLGWNWRQATASEFRTR